MRLSRGRGGNPEANEPVEVGDGEFVDAPPGDLLVEEVPTSDTVTVLAAVNLLPSDVRPAGGRQAGPRSSLPSRS